MLRSLRILMVCAGLLPLDTALAQLSASAGDYPNRAVRVIVPFAPGGATDILARVAADELARRLGQPFVVENQGGAGGLIATARVAKAAPDGYTLVAATPGPVTISPVTQKTMPYDAAALTPVTLIADGPGVLVVRKDSPHRTLADLVAAGKARPGSLTFGSAGVGAFSHLSSELFKRLAGLDAVHVPYKGTGAATADLLGGRLDFYVEYFPAVQKLIDSGDLRALAVTTPQRFPIRPEIPTMQEGGVAGYEGAAWVGLMAPPDTPAPIVQRLQETLAQALREPAVAQRINQMGVVPGGQPPDQFGRYVATERERYKQLADAIGLVITPN